MPHKSSGVDFFLSKLFCPAALKDFIAERLCAVFQKITVREKNLLIRCLVCNRLAEPFSV